MRLLPLNRLYCTYSLLTAWVVILISGDRYWLCTKPTLCAVYKYHRLLLSCSTFFFIEWQYNFSFNAMVMGPYLFLIKYYATVQILWLGISCVQLAHLLRVMMHLHIMGCYSKTAIAITITEGLISSNTRIFSEMKDWSQRRFLNRVRICDLI